MTTMPPEDIVSRYLKNKGEQIKPVYFLSSTVFLGWKLRRGAMELVYRLDPDNQLIICDLSAQESGSGMQSAMLDFVHFVKEVKRAVLDVSHVRGTFFIPMSNPELANARRRLMKFLEGQGAHWEEIDAQPWLVF